MRTCHIRVFGRVQGVFFRSSVRELAVKLGICGWVKNNPDGSVEVMAQGSDSSIKKLVSFCNVGPQFAKVERVEVKYVDTTPFNGFRIIY